MAWCLLLLLLSLLVEELIEKATSGQLLKNYSYMFKSSFLVSVAPFDFSKALPSVPLFSLKLLVAVISWTVKNDFSPNTSSMMSLVIHSFFLEQVIVNKVDKETCNYMIQNNKTAVDDLYLMWTDKRMLLTPWSSLSLEYNFHSDLESIYRSLLSINIFFCQDCYCGK